jgi:nucleotide-binding universal stress UspA family protein
MHCDTQYMLSALHCAWQWRDRESSFLFCAHESHDGPHMKNLHVRSHAMLKLLIPIGSSKASRHAVQRVIQRAWAGEPLEAHLLHVLPSRQDNGVDTVDGAAELLERASVPYVAHICYGRPAPEIVRFAERNRFSGVVMASAGLGSISEMLLGSVTAQVLRTSHIPVEVVPVSPRSRARAYAGPAGVGLGLGVLLYNAFQ